MSESPAPRPSRPLPPVAIVIGVLFFFGLLGLMIYGVMKSGDPQRDVLPSALIDKPAPAFALPVLHDPQMIVRSEELRGAPYLLNVWGSWCPACRDEHPVITRLAESGVVKVIGYDYKDTTEDAQRWLQQFGNPYDLVITDEEGRAALDWGIYGAPETFLVDAQGVIRWKHVGAIDQVPEDFQIGGVLEVARQSRRTGRDVVGTAERGRLGRRDLLFDAVQLDQLIDHRIGDIRSPEGFAEAVEDIDAEIVFHLAAQSSVSASDTLARVTRAMSAT